MPREKDSLQYQLCKEALKDITTDRTRSAYKRHIKSFAVWEREHPAPEQLSPAERVQRWERVLEAEGAAPATIHSKLAPVCKGFGVSMSEIEHPRRTADQITRGRDPEANAQGRAEMQKERYSRSVTLSQCTGLRRAELARVRPSDFCKDESGYDCIRVKGKGGKLQLQRILPGYVKSVDDVIGFDFYDGKVLDREEIGSHINYHSLRADLAREAYDYYATRLKVEPGYRDQLRKELMARYDAYHRPGKDARDRFTAQMADTPYVLRGANARRARSAGRPLEYDRLALLAVSVFHLAHWRLDVTVTNYLV